jgi:amino acid transporter
MAAKRIFIRILIFYVLTIFMIGLVVPSNDPNLLQSTGTASQSPFVIAARLAGIKVIPSIINAVVLTSAWSSGNSSMLGGSRVLYGMAIHGHAPKIFTKINRFGIPYLAVAFFSAFLCLGYMTLNWICICIIYLRFFYGCKKQGIDRHSELPWAAPLQPYTTWASLTVFITLLFTGGYATFIHGEWSTETFISSYINIPIILLLYFGAKFWMKSSIIPLAELPIRHFIDIYQANPEPPEAPKRGLQKLNILWS